MSTCEETCTLCNREVVLTQNRPRSDGGSIVVTVYRTVEYWEDDCCNEHGDVEDSRRRPYLARIKLDPRYHDLIGWSVYSEEHESTVALAARAIDDALKSCSRTKEYHEADLKAREKFEPWEIQYSDHTTEQLQLYLTRGGWNALRNGVVVGWGETIEAAVGYAQRELATFGGNKVGKRNPEKYVIGTRRVPWYSRILKRRSS